MSLADQVVVALREEIMTGTLSPGDALHIEEVARRLNVSRTPVREALANLQAAGLVTKQANSAPTVFRASHQNALEFYEMRIALEPMAGELATPEVSSAELDELRRLVSAMDEYRPAEWFDLNRQFHTRVYALAGRPHLLEVINGLIDRCDPYMRLYFTMHDLEETQAGHRRILDALERGEVASVGTAIRDHLAEVVAGIVAAIEGTQTS
jgi:DNA-binding GntR family transcriptional regulator